MIFGLFTIPSSNLIFRKLDGVWTAHAPLTAHSHKAAWDYYSSDPGKMVDGNTIENNKGLHCLTYSRATAKALYGVPNNIELYTKDAKSVQIYDKVTYNAEYNKAKYDRVEMKIPKGKKAEWQAKAKATGMSLTEYISKKMEEA